MNDYALKVKAQDVQQLYILATALGVLVPVKDSTEYTLSPSYTGGWKVIGPVYEPTGEIIYGTPHEVPVYESVTTEVPHEFIPDLMVEVTSSVPVGTKMVTPQTIVTAPVVDDQGVPYWHANLRLESASLMEIAQEVAKTNPLVAAGLSDLARWFVTDESGRAKMPANPANVWL
jgi:hypothetical protein